MAIIALVIATLVPLVVLYIVYTLDLYGTGAFRNIALAFVWGGISVALAYYANEAVYYGASLDFQTLSRYVAPFIEEVLKALILLYLIQRPDFTYFVDGAIYGFAAGVGFAVFENYFYIYSNMDAGLGTAVSRVLSTNLMHASASALVGISLGMARFQRISGRLFFLLGGLLAAMLFHMGFNFLVTQQDSDLLLIYAIVGGLVGLGIVGFFIRRGLAEEKQWIEEKLGAADRVTNQEAAVVQNLSQAHVLLQPLVDIFGEEKANQIEDFLVLQARLGILRKTVDKLEGNPKMQASVRAQMDEIRIQMDDARRAVGAYTMASLRTLFPDESSPVWGRLESAIQEKIAVRPATGGSNLFALAGQRAAARGRGDSEG